MANIATDAVEPWSADSFWKAPPRLPEGLSLRRLHALWLSARPGPRGQDFFEDVLLSAPSADSHLLVAYKAPLLARDVPVLKRRLAAVIDERRRDPEDRVARVPALFTNVAPPAVREMCRREWVGLVDQTGTVILQQGPVFVFVEGSQKVKPRLRASAFRGKGARVLRCLLASTGAPLQAKRIAELTNTSFAYCYAVLTRLEEEGYVERRSPRTGFRLARPVELLRAWSDSGYRSAATVEPFYAPSTSPRDLDHLARKLEAIGAPFAFTLMSATREEDVFVGGAPHGLYLAGDLRLVVDELKLRKVTPHNFLVLRPEPDAAVTDYGVFQPGKRHVSEPQLILDFIAHGGPRGREQAEHLARRWSERLPLLSLAE
ncbi:MAG: Rrf2 family transcriptional regulator [Myxococcales bacterium]|nr:Rrf2 family transcriptional regulator [Myxococcales bacterium]